MNEFGQVVVVDHVLAVSMQHRTAIALASLVAYPDRVILDLQILRGHRHDWRFWKDATNPDDPDSIRMTCTSRADIVPALTPIRLPAPDNADLLFVASGPTGSGGGWESADGAVTDGYTGRWTAWPYPKTGRLVVWWSWTAGGLEPGSAEFSLPESVPASSIWD